MTKNLASCKFACSFLVCLAVLFLCVSPVLAQSSRTGALTGTITDPSGGVIAGATVTATELATSQDRATTTDSTGTYRFTALPSGAYRLKISANGFKTADIPSVTVAITESRVLNQALEVGAQTEQVTVEATTERLQTQNATVGTLVGGKELTDLPLSGRNYTQVIDLSPGVIANVASASAVGNGTQDINVNGMGSDQNNYLMDGASQTNYGSGGGAQSGNFPGIGIPNPDSIQEFRIQTSQYDAGYGRNPGASVSVVTKGGSNSFHGAAWEFFRNSFFDGNDKFNKASESELGFGNKPQPLDQNEFGGALGGPIKKDKMFFFGSYQGFRQKNGIGTNGFAAGTTNGLTLLPFNEPDGTRADEPSLVVPLNLQAGGAPCPAPTYRAYLGCVFANNFNLLSLPFGSGVSGGLGGTGVPILSDGSTINNVAINVLRAPGPQGGVNNGFYVPSLPFGSNGLPVCNPAAGLVGSCSTFSLSDPILANENQYLGNYDWIINPKNTFTERFFYSSDPQTQSFVCLGPCQPGAPEDVTYTAMNVVLKLTTIINPNLVNEVHASFQRQTTVASSGNYISSCSVDIVPILNEGNPCPEAISSANPVLNQIPTFTILGVPGANITGPAGPVLTGGTWNNGGNFFASATNFFNTFQEYDQLSWNHGKHTVRFGGQFSRIQYNWTLPSRGGLFFANLTDFLTSSSGNANTGTAAAPGGVFINFAGVQPPDGNLHNLRANQIDAFVQDDIRVSSKLTMNFGVRWEYDGWPSDTRGLYTNTWASQAALVNTGSFFLGNQVALGPGNPANANQIGTLAGYVVPSNYNPNIQACGTFSAPAACGLTSPAGATGVYTNTNKTLVHGFPNYAFAPRIGLAWQPLSPKFVIRAGYGIFYDAVYANLLANNQAGNPPYSGAPPFLNSEALDVPNPVVPALGWTNPRTLAVFAGSPATGATSILNVNGGTGVGGSRDSETIGVPLIQQYNLDLQYQLGHNWVADVGYVGSHGTHLYDWNRPINVALLVPGAPNEPTDPQNAGMIIGSGTRGTPSSLPFNDVSNTNPSTQVLENTTGNILGRVSYLGFGTAALASTSTLGDSLYNSLQMSLKHQFANGLFVQASYTWSKSFTNVDYSEAGTGIAAGGNVLSGGAGSNDPLNLTQQYGLAAFNRPQRFVMAYSYAIPHKNTEGISGKLLGGWGISGVITIQDGEPFTVIDGRGGTIYYTALPFGPANVRGELASPGNCNAAGVCQSTVPVATSGGNGSRLGGIFGGGGWINTSAFTTEPCIGGTVQGNCLGSGGGTGWGNSGLGIISGPGQNNFDFSITKDTRIMEGLTMQFRSEFYNLWNHAQYNPPGNDLNTTTFGVISSSSVPPRVVQFGLKFLF